MSTTSISSDSIPILLDTDPGSDIDDAVAIAYLLRQPRCEFLGITTVSGDTAKRAAIARYICDAAGRSDVPIHAGTSRVLLTGPGQPYVPHYEAIAHLAHQRDWPANGAIDFLRKTIGRRPGEITLLTIGPLTNIALLFAIDPEIPALLKQVVSMAGVFFPEKPSREWNCMVDPIATAMVYNAHPPRHISIGLDVTTKCAMNSEEVHRRFIRPPLDVINAMADVWFKHTDRMIFHDPLAAVSIFQPEVCQYTDGQIAITQDDTAQLAGQTLFTTSDSTAPHRVAKSVNAPAFFNAFFSVFT